MGQVIVFIVPIGALGLWVLLRLALFASERSRSGTLPSDFPRFVVGLLRFVLIVLAGVAAGLVAFLGAVVVLMSGINSSEFRLGSSQFGIFIGLVSIGLYGLAAVILNFPYFPLERHARLFVPVQILLVPVIAVLPQIGFKQSLALLAALAGYFFFWWLCLRDRITYRQP